MNHQDGISAGHVGSPAKSQRKLTVAAALVLLAAIGGVSGCGRDDARAGGPTPANIILIVIDTLRADHLGCYGYFRDTSPNIDAFSRQAVFFEQTFAPMATTLPSHTSLFTGVYPLEHGIVANFGDGGKPFRSRPGLQPIAEIAKANGYATAAFVSAAPLKRVAGLDAGFDVYSEPTGATRTAPEVTDAALSWLAQYADGRFLLFVHYFDTHVPYRPPPAYARMFQTDAALEAYLAERQIPDVVQPGLCRGRHATVTRRATNLYDAEIRFCDEHVGRLLDAIRERGLWDQSVIVLMADHGEGLNQHEWPQHGRTWNEQVHVPLMIRFPGQPADLPKRFTPLVSLIDVLPTVLGRIRPSWSGEFAAQAYGRDALAPGFSERPVLSERSGRDCGDFGGSLYALTTPQWRYHLYASGEELLFDRKADPYELHDTAAGAAQQAGAARRQTLALVAELEKRAERLGGVDSAVPPVSDELLRQMEALGYAGSLSAEGEETPVTSRPDRKKPSDTQPSGQPPKP